MLNLTLTAGQLKITPLFWSLGLAFVLSSFSLWRRLTKEEYNEQDIFATSLFMLLAGVAFGRLSSVVLGAGEIGGLAGPVLFFVWRTRMQGNNVWDGLDALAPSFLYFLIFWGAGLFLTSGKILSFSYLAIGVGGLMLLFFLKQRYRRFSLYPSGKTGFLCLAATFYAAVLLLVLDFFLADRLYWAKLFWLALAAASAAAVYFRAKE